MPDVLTFVCICSLSPTNQIPDFFYADWQYAKRHGLLDDDGNIDQEAYEKHAKGKGFW